ncbi:hypothetical protein ACA910_015872 [Epithemia clementina (nom. ined.)]
MTLWASPPRRSSVASILDQKSSASLSTVTLPDLSSDSDNRQAFYDHQYMPPTDRHPKASIMEQVDEDNAVVIPTDATKKSVVHDDDDDDIHAYLERKGIQSRPKPSGNWNVRDPLGWTKGFGRRSPATQAKLDPLIRLQPGDEGYFPVDSNLKVPNVTMVRTKEQARIVLERLYNSAESLNAFHACDTEVMEIDLKETGPVGNGYVTCLSMYAGPDFDYGLGDGPGTCLWIDNLDDACGILQEFKDWLEDDRYMKVWHNIGFDRHVLWNEGIDVRGFGGDTMHMARLQNTSRLQYSLEKLTAILLSNQTAAAEEEEEGDTTSTTTTTKAKTTAATATEVEDHKTSMREIFGVAKKRKDGTDGKIKILPPVEVLQRDPTHRSKWIQYSTHDARMTWELRERLYQLLSGQAMAHGENVPVDWLHGKTMWDYYWRHMRPFGELLTDMERRGIRVDAKEYLASVEETARQDRQRHERIFRHWVASLYPPELRAHGLALNMASSAQLQTFLFGGFQSKNKNGKNKNGMGAVEPRRIFSVPRSEIPQEALDAFEEQMQKELDEQRNPPLTTTNDNDGSTTSNAYDKAMRVLEEKLQNSKVADLKADCKQYGLKVSGKKSDLQDRIREHLKQSLLIQSKQEENGMFGDMSDEDLANALQARQIYRDGMSREEMEEVFKHDIDVMGELDLTDDSDYGIARALGEYALAEGTVFANYLHDRPVEKKPPKKNLDLQVISLYELMKKEKPLVPTKFTAGGGPSVTADVLRALAGDPFADPPKYGQAFDLCGEEGCKALYSLCAIGSIDTMISNFLTSLQQLVDDDSRVHCGLNLNTETGRLSSRRPNLQNQPALEKDKYKIRKAFQSSPGNNLIVADYGQLELRIMASMTECKSMVKAFMAGGDFHSRTALDMFDYIKEKVDAGEVLLEWDYSQGKPPKPLLKDEYASERRKAKTLNFSIAYGKTAHGLSIDWGVSHKEAQEIVNKWYAARQEVEKWQMNTKKRAREQGYTRTLMGRYRHFPNHENRDWRSIGAVERASINTPIQGGAADVVMMAMIKINESQKLKDLGWILLLQIHDEVILEGPEETANEAFDEVVQCMQEPWTQGLDETQVPLLVDGSWDCQTWYDAK